MTERRSRWLNFLEIPWVGVAAAIAGCVAWLGGRLALITYDDTYEPGSGPYGSWRSFGLINSLFWILATYVPYLLWGLAVLSFCLFVRRLWTPAS
jgi:hypothetical protein